MTKNKPAVLAFAGIAALVVTTRPASPVGAQDTGCCQFFTRAGAARNHGRRPCDELTREKCTVVRSRSTFLAGWRCDSQTQRCTVRPSGPTQAICRERANGERTGALPAGGPAALTRLA